MYKYLSHLPRSSRPVVSSPILFIRITRYPTKEKDKKEKERKTQHPDHFKNYAVAEAAVVVGSETEIDFSER